MSMRAVFFVEHYNKRTLADRGLTFDFVQDNLSLSKQTGTVRGLHFQPPPSEQTKLVSVVRGAVLDVIVDLHVGSPTFGRHAAVELSEANGLQVLVPRGFAHGLLHAVGRCAGAVQDRWLLRRGTRPRAAVERSRSRYSLAGRNEGRDPDQQG